MIEEQASGSGWSEIHHRLDRVEAALKQRLEPSSAEKKQILQARASALAKEITKKEATQSIEIVEFLLASEKYGIESSYVREVYPMKQFTPLPCTPSFVLGIISVRGQILSVIDIKKYFDLPEKGLTDLNKVILVHTPAMELGILADTILGVRSIPLAQIRPPLPTWTGIHAEYLNGITNERLAILDVEKILSDKRSVVHEEVDG